MLNNNPFSLLAEIASPLAMQGFIIAMVLLIAIGTIIQMIHHKNLTYFFNNAKKAKLAATKELGIGEKTSIIAKTTVVDIGTTSELGFGKRRLAHVLGMYGTILFWIASAETSTLKKNQNQYPPKQVKIAPTCQSIDHVSEFDLPTPV